MASKVFEKTSGEYDEARQVIEEAQEQVITLLFFSHLAV